MFSLKNIPATFDMSDTAIWSLRFISAVYIAASLFFLNRNFRTKPAFRVFCIVLDLSLATILVSETGHEESVFSFIYFLPILVAATDFALRGAILTGALTVLLFTVTVFINPSPTVPNWIRLLIHDLAFATTALMAGQLSLRLRRATQTILELRQINEAVYAHIPSGIIVFDANGTVLSANPSAKKILGFQDSTLPSRIDDVLPTAMTLKPSHPEDRLFLDYKHPRMGRRDLGYSVAVLPIDDGGKKATLLSFQDLTKIHQIEQQLWTSRKLAAIGRLAASIAHEIRNPLASISGCVEMLQQFLPSDEEPKKLMQIVLKETDRLNHLITEFLDYVRQENMDLKPHNLSRFLQELLADVKLRKGLNTAVTFDVSIPDGLMVNIDNNKLRQAFLNLIINAVQAIPNQGTVTVSAQKQENSIKVVVADTGVGIKAENLEKIFDPFFTTKEKGTGLGLAMTQKIIELHQGKISVESKEHRGTQFSVWLPEARE
jgi:two-component system sensor histidine kinase PilS (NtrC family)